ncbi:type VII secretion protein EssB [Filibacter tadaridae]|uniref:Putative membrane protein essB n=2 Tax=Filibacter tadaridae TaxID=2483811 RepID=A0A3P5WU56_9BACL|nr:putative membrane protein essB [Filibacter tadaridae]
MMPTEPHTYLKNLISGDINEEEKKSTFIFQKERIGLKKSAEVTFLKEVNPEIEKEVILTEDELIVTATIPESFKRFDAIHLEDAKIKWMFAHQLVEKIDAHPYPRLNLIVCPENIVYSRGMTSAFIYYGVLESLPPFENDDERVWLETKAAVATAVDGSFTYDEFIKYHKTLELKETGATIMGMSDSQSLLDYIEEQLEQQEEREKTFIKLPQKKWKTTKWLTIGLGILFIPALIFAISNLLYDKPKNEAYLDSHESYLLQNYSEVVTVLSPYRVKRMPYVVLYELAHASVTNEKLDEEQKKNVLANITLQTDEDYLKYWIYIGRAEAAKAVDLARAMEDGELLTYGLLKKREEIQADPELTGEEKQQLMAEIDTEVEAYEKLMEQEEKQKLEEQQREKELEAEKEQEEQEKQQEQKERQEEQKNQQQLEQKKVQQQKADKEKSGS